MAKKKNEYDVTIGYRAVVSFMIKADDAETAKQIALQKVKEQGIYEGEIQDENYTAAGVVNMTESWNMVQS